MKQDMLDDAIDAPLSIVGLGRGNASASSKKRALVVKQEKVAAMKQECINVDPARRVRSKRARLAEPVEPPEETSSQRDSQLEECNEWGIQ